MKFNIKVHEVQSQRTIVLDCGMTLSGAWVLLAWGRSFGMCINSDLKQRFSEACGAQPANLWQALTAATTSH